MDVLPLLRTTAPVYVALKEMANLPAHAEEEDLGSDDIVGLACLSVGLCRLWWVGTGGGGCSGHGGGERTRRYSASWCESWTLMEVRGPRSGEGNHG